MALQHRCRIGTLRLLVFLMLLSLIQTLPLNAEELTKEVKKGDGGNISLKETAGVEGIATYYAKRYHGRRTHSGERYHPEKMTAAHPTLPVGTWVKVTNLTNRNEVVVRINDRCRKKRVPIIDLSRAAARKLGFLGKGNARVLMTKLEEEEPS